MITKDEFVNDLKNQLDELNTGIDNIEKKVKVVREGSKARLQARITYLREKRDAALSKLQEVKNTSEETWQDMKKGTINIINSLKNAILKTKSHFKKRKDDIIVEN
ncbi:MAG: hypothetical protein JW881_02875 [Spirochaetales bacterium]|nr:hypothetical protein [Spirochaetales bacterium]